MVLDTPIPLLIQAYEGRVSMIQAIFGGGDEGKPAKNQAAPAKPQSPDQVAMNLKMFFARRTAQR